MERPYSPNIRACPACGAATDSNAGSSDNKGWHTQEHGENSAPFIIDDGTGKCIVDPEGAEILTRHKDSWTSGDYRYTEWRLLDIDFIYTLGEFKTVGGSNITITHDDLVKDVLSEWKMDNDTLMQRFDLDENGVLDMREWMLARSAAKREAEKRLNEILAEPDTNFMLQPHDGRLFLISNLDQRQACAALQTLDVGACHHSVRGAGWNGLVATAAAILTVCTDMRAVATTVHSGLSLRQILIGRGDAQTV